jgi:hypothetical protein
MYISDARALGDDQLRKTRFFLAYKMAYSKINTPDLNRVRVPFSSPLFRTTSPTHPKPHQPKNPDKSPHEARRRVDLSVLNYYNSPYRPTNRTTHQ